MILFALVFLIYITTLYPNVSGGDSGELLSAICTTGIAHPPGYPLYLITTKLFSGTMSLFNIAPGKTAFQINLFSAICSAASAALLSFCVLEFFKDKSKSNRVLATLIACLFATTSLVWRYSIQSEVFALNSLIITAFLYTVFRLGNDTSHIFILSLLAGLGISNHHTSVFITLPILGHYLFLNIRKWPKLLFGISLGLLPYLYLVIAPRFFPIASTWGATTTFHGFFVHFFRREYGTFQLASSGHNSSSGLTLYLWEFLKRFSKDSFFLGLPLASLGFYFALKKTDSPKFKRLNLILGYSLLVYLLFFHSLVNLPVENPVFLETISRFWIQAYILLFFWIGLATIYLSQTLRLRFSLLSIGLIAVLISVGFRMNSMNQSKNAIFHDFASTILNSLPKNSVLLVKGDLFSNTLNYLQSCEHTRTDVILVDQELMTYEWYKTGISKLPIHDFISKNFSRNHIFVLGGFRSEDTSWKKSFQTVPFGYVDEIITIGTITDSKLAEERKTLLPNLSTYSSSNTSSKSFGPWEDVLVHDLIQAHHKYAEYFLTKPDISSAEHARDILEEIASTKNPKPYVYKNLGIAYSRLLQTDPTAQSKMKLAWKTYLDLTGNADPEASIIKKNIQSFD